MKSPRVLKIGKYRIHVRIFKPHYVPKDICPTWGIVRHLFSVVIVGAFFSIIISWQEFYKTIEITKELLDALQWLIDSEDAHQYALEIMKKAKRKIKKAEKLALDKQPEV